jgi:hypothetical protein
LAWAILVALFSTANAGQPQGPPLAALQPPIKLDELLVWRDGGSLGFKLSDAARHHVAFCVDGRIGSTTVGYFFLNVTHPTQDNGQKLDLGGDTEKTLISYLKSWLEASFKPEQLTALLLKEKDVNKLTKDEFNAWHVLRLVENRAKAIKRMKEHAQPRSSPIAGVSQAEQKALSDAFAHWLKGENRGPWPTYAPGAISRSTLNVVVSAPRAAAATIRAYSALEKKDIDVLVLPLTIQNNSAVPIQTTLEHEWHGGEWPPTNLYVSVLGPGEKAHAQFTPVFLAGETGKEEKPTLIEPGKSVSLSPRLDWQGTGSVRGDPVVDRAGVYKLMLLLVFEAEGKKQFVQSDPIALRH